MTISSIHILEALAIFLVGIKLLKIRSLYLNSGSQASAKAKEPKPKANQATAAKKLVRARKPIVNANQFLNPLPEPEVRFSPNREDVRYTTRSEEVVMTEVPQEHKEEKCILGSYIDDFFSQSPDESFFEEPSRFNTPPLKSNKSQRVSEDEFITVREENAELIRAMESIKRDIRLPL